MPSHNPHKSFNSFRDLPAVLANSSCKGNTDSVCQRMQLGTEHRRKWDYDRTARLNKKGGIALEKVIVVKVTCRNRNERYSYIE